MRAAPFVAANCGGFVPGLAASELFGHEAGAFTGAVRRRVGRFEASHRGTLLLDEVGELPPELQPLLLRVLESKAVERVGGDAVSVDVRIITATNRDLTADVRAARFRADLFYRLNIFPIVVPPLRDRREDIAALSEYFLRHFAAAHNRAVTTITARGLQLLARYDWPGNVRELRNVIERAVLTSPGPELQVDPAWLTSDTSPTETARTWAVQEKTRILEALARLVVASTALAARPSALAFDPPRFTARCGSTTSAKILHPGSDVSSLHDQIASPFLAHFS